MRTSRIAGGRYTSAAVLISLCLGTLLPAANVTKLDTTSIAATTANWSTAPATTDVGEFAGTPSSSTMANLTLGGADLTIGGLQFDGTMTGAATIGSGNTLTLGTSGINMSAANQNVTINCGLALAGGIQSWNVLAGRTLTVGGAFSHTGAEVDFSSFAGTLGTLGNSGSTGILGPWALTGSGTSMKYATVSGGAVSPFTGTAAATAANVTDTGGTVNYDVAAVGTLGTGANFNTLRYTGAGGTIGGNFTANGLMLPAAAGLTFSGNVAIGSTKELVVIAQNSSSSTYQFNGTITSTETTGDNVISVSVPNSGSQFNFGGGAGQMAGFYGTIKFGSSACLVKFRDGTLAVATDKNLGNATVDLGTGSAGMTFKAAAASSSITQTIGMLLGGSSTSIDDGDGASSGTTYTYKVGGLNTDGQFDGTIKQTASRGTVAISKTGTGTWTLTGAHAYTGSTIINAGKLKLKAGSLGNTAIAFTGTGTLAVQPGSATTINIGSTATAAAGATLNLGAQTFDMTDGAISTCNLQQGSTYNSTPLTIANGATLKFNLGNSSADLLAITKGAATTAASVSGTVNVTLDTSLFTNPTPGTYNLITAASGLTAGSPTWQFAGGGTRTLITVAGTPYSLNLVTSDTAISVQVAQTYTLAYNGNGSDGGTVPTDSNSPYNSGVTVTVLGAGTMTKSGYSFTGWNTAANGSGTSYSAGNTFAIAANTILYAQWTVASGSITAPSTFPAALSTTYGTTSSPQSVSVSGSGLTADITATVTTAGLEISSDGATYGSTATFPQSSGSASGTLYIRLKNNALVSGTYNSQSVVLTSTGVSSVNVATTSSGNAVTAKALTLSGAAAQSKLSDGTTAAAITGTLSGVVNGDSVTLNGTGTFASAAVGTGIAVTSTSTLGGTGAGNYTLTQPTGLTADILGAAVWNNGSGGLWGTSGNWFDNVIGTGSGQTADFSQLDITADTTISLDSARTVGNLTFGDTDTSSAAGWTLDNNSTPANTLTLAGTTPTVTVNALGTGKKATISAVVAGTSGLTKSGNGTLVLSAVNTYTGDTTISGGNLQINGSGTLNSGSYAGNINDAGALVYNSSAAQTLSGVISGSGSLTLSGASTLTLSGANTYSGGTTVTAGTLSLANGTGAGSSSATITAANGATLNVANSTTFIAAGVTVSGANATVTLTSANATGGFNDAFTGSSDQTVAIGGSTAVNLSSSSKQFQNMYGTVSIPNATSMAFRNSSLNNGGDNALFAVDGTLTTRNGGAVALGALSGAGSVKSGTSAAGALTYTIGARGTDANFSGVIADGGVNNVVSVIKTGSATQTLSGANTYSGNTTINAGTLALSGSGSLVSANLSVATGAKLDVSALTGGSFALNGAGTLTLRINKTGATDTQGQMVIGANNLTYGGALTVTATGDALANGDSFALVSKTTGGLSGWFNSTSLPTLASGLAWDTNDLATSGVLDVYSFTTTTLTVSTLTNTPAIVSAAKLATHASSSKVGAYPAGWSASASTPAHGAASFSSGTLTYTPTTDYAGNDTFTVTFLDGHGSQTMTVNVTVNSQNVGPSITPAQGANGSFTAAGLPGTNYVIQLNTNLSVGVGWVDYKTNTAASNGLINFQDDVSVSDHGGQVYYRLKQYVAP